MNADDSSDLVPAKPDPNVNPITGVREPPEQRSGGDRRRPGDGEGGAGRKNDAGKLRWRLMPWQAVTLVMQVLERGAVKYEPGNWRSVPDARDRYFEAALRHLLAWERGEPLDPEWQLPHLAHCAACVLFLLALDHTDGK